MKRFSNRHCTPGFFKVTLDVGPDGVDIYAWVSEQSSSPEWDYYLNDLEEAKQFSLDRFGAKLETWTAD